MARFLTGNALNLELENIFEEAREYLLIISPYIKLHERYISALIKKKDNHNLEIIVVFGKNEEDMSRSMKQSDFDFFKQFPNIEIRYEKRLHAKYYANEDAAILTSMNLYSYSQDTNIEAGVLTKVTLINGLVNTIRNSEGLDEQAWNYFGQTVVEQSELLFKKAPEYESKTFGLSKKYIGSKIEKDELSVFFANKTSAKITNRSNGVISEVHSPVIQVGYCIRTGVEIPFNVEKPMTASAFKSWSKYGDSDYPEKFCHFSGEQSNNETSFSKPILKKYWKKAKETFNL